MSIEEATHLCVRLSARVEELEESVRCLKAELEAAEWRYRDTYAAYDRLRIENERLKRK